jgi:hypothetical protein
MSIPILSRVTRTFLPAGFFLEVPLPGRAAPSAERSLAPFVSNRGEIESPELGPAASVSWLRLTLIVLLLLKKHKPKVFSVQDHKK